MGWYTVNSHLEELPAMEASSIFPLLNSSGGTWRYSYLQTQLGGV